MKRIALLTIASIAAAAPAAADQAQLGWRTLAEYDSRVTATNGGQGDGIFTFGPQIRIEGERRRFQYRIDQHSSYEKHVDIDELDDWRHELTTSFVYTVSPRVQIRVNNRFQQLPQVRNGSLDDAAIDGNEDNTTFLDTGRVRTDVFSTTLSFVPTARVLGTSQLSVIYREFQNASLNAQNTVSTSTYNHLSYQLNERHTFGGGFRFSSRDFQTGFGDELTDANTKTWEGFASWQWQIDSRSTFSAQAGPAFSSDNIDRSTVSSFPRYPLAFIDFGGGNVNAFFPDPANCPAEDVRPGGVIPSFACAPFVVQQDPGPPVGPPSTFILFGIPVTSPTFAALAAQRTTFPIDQPDSAAGDSANIFFSFRLDRHWDRAEASISWVRSDSQTQALGSSTVVDAIRFGTSYELSSRMRAFLDFRFTQRSSKLDRQSIVLLMSDTVSAIPLSEVPTPDGIPLRAAPIVGTYLEDSGFDQTLSTYNLRLRLSRDWGRWITSNLTLDLRRQETKFDSDIDSLDFNSSADSWDLMLSFTYQFKPIDF